MAVGENVPQFLRYRSAKVQAKLRDAQAELVPSMIVVGPREAGAGAVALRDRIHGDSEAHEY